MHVFTAAFLTVDNCFMHKQVKHNIKGASSVYTPDNMYIELVMGISHQLMAIIDLNQYIIYE